MSKSELPDLQTDDLLKFILSTTLDEKIAVSAWRALRSLDDAPLFLLDLPYHPPSQVTALDRLTFYACFAEGRSVNATAKSLKRNWRTIAKVKALWDAMDGVAREDVLSRHKAMVIAARRELRLETARQQRRYLDALPTAENGDDA